MSEDFDAGADVGGRGELLWVVAEAVTAAEKKHGDGANF
jgi:hypothetical protein